MKFHVLLPVRDESDLIAQSLSQLLRWADAIYVFDTGSVDDTWEIVSDYAQRDRRIVRIRKEAVYFSETRLRGYMFHVARQTMRTGDWFLRVDADEFHHILPPEFVKTQMRKHETLAYHQYYDFRLTASEVAAWQRGEESLADRARPIEERRRHYTVSVYAEPRLCRYRDTMQWPETVSFPFNAGYVAHERLPIRHYPHRDPVQLERRWHLRALMLSDPTRDGGSFTHWQQPDWQTLITPADLPGLEYWAPGAELPLVHQSNHIPRWPVRIAQQIIHSCLLQAFDKHRDRFDEEARPVPIPQHVQDLGGRVLPTKQEPCGR